MDKNVTYYTSDKNFQVVRRLTAQNVKGDNKKIEKTYPTWTDSANFINFKKGEKVGLTDTDLELPAIKKLISLNVIRKTL